MQTLYVLLIVSLLLGISNTALVAKEIELPGAKSMVIPQKNRATVIDVAERLILRTDSSTSQLSGIDETPNPFIFEEEVVEVVKVEKKPIAAPIVYGDDSILKAVSLNFSPQVQGTLAKGNVNYLQIRGGGLVKPGSTFPVKLPQLKGQTHTVTISAVSSNSYTLKLNDTELEVPLLGASSGGAVRFQPE